MSDLEPARNHAGDTVAIIDFGAQYAKVIDRRVRELGVQTRIISRGATLAELKQFKALILSGSPESVSQDKLAEQERVILQAEIPVLGICYGLQLLAYLHGANVQKGAIREDGQETITVDTTSPLFHSLQPQQKVLLTHGDCVEDAPEGWRVTARSEQGIVLAMEKTEGPPMFGVQFHPEVDLSESGKEMLQNFVINVAKVEPNYTIDDREHLAITEIQHKVLNQSDTHQVLVLVSGGVDSTVCAALLGKALEPSLLHCLHIDNGFLRYQESEQVVAALTERGIPVKFVDAAEEFYNATTTISGKETLPLNRVMNPEEKRKIIGDTFVRVAERVIGELGLEKERVLLAQGTLRPDLIESASCLASISGKASVIKTHHNDTHLVRALREAGRVIEPLKEYHKDEVRELGQKLGLPREMVWRQPFPGPGLSVRIICTDAGYFPANYSTTVQQLQDFVASQQQIESSSSSFSSSSPISASLLPIQTVGVQGDERSYGYGVALSGATVQGKFEKEGGRIDWASLFRLAHLIPKHIHCINRCVFVLDDPSQPIYDQNFLLPQQPLGPRNITPTTMTVEVIEQVRQADKIVNELLQQHDLTQSISQMPVILFPVCFSGTPEESGFRSIALRPFITNDFMTGTAAIPGKDIPESLLLAMARRIKEEVPGISRVVLDLTSKPPGTTEWE